MISEDMKFYSLKPHFIYLHFFILGLLTGKLVCGGSSSLPHSDDMLSLARPPSYFGLFFFLI